MRIYSTKFKGSLQVLVQHVSTLKLIFVMID